jgi:hypothetical protein
MDELRSRADGPAVRRAPRVEAVVTVHTTTRPVERAAASLLRNSVDLRVTVIAHNIEADSVRARLADIGNDSRVRILELADGVRSPANAYNFALDNLEGEFLSLVGSDDELSPGALDAWVALADRSAADVVIAPIRRVGGGAVPSPRVRPGRRERLDGDRDRLFERVAPLGLVRRATFPRLRFTEGLPRGVDQVFGLNLWFSGASVAFDPGTPAYLEWDDQRDRVTMAPGPLADDVAYLDAWEADPIAQAMTPAARRAVAAKIVRVHLIGAIASRVSEAGLSAADRETVARAMRRLRAWAPSFERILSLRDRRAVRAALDAGASGTALREAIGDRSRVLSARALVTVDPLKILHRHAPLRSLAAGLRVARAVASTAERSAGH